MRAIQLLRAVSGLRGLLEWRYNLMLLIMGFHIFLSVALFHSPSLSPSLPCLHTIQHRLPIFSGSSDHPPSLGSERLCSELPPLRPDSQAREQVPRQICRWAGSVKSNALAVT